MSDRRRIPTATYRLQFNRSFRFEDARALVSYLNRLGVSDIYASPILKARRGSSHGYDVTDPTHLNPELGTERDFDALVEELRHDDMGLLLDIVPNHMAASPENPWWRNVKEKGRDSPFTGFFDTDWLNFKDSNGGPTIYRRFFDIGDLIGVRVEDPQVFEATHSYILQLIAEGKVAGLRIDHIDGLYDPLEYLRRLKVSTGGTYTVVEKILSDDEALLRNWPVSGTTGYDFANVLNCLFVDRDGIKALNNLYTQVTGLGKSFRELVYEKKRQVMLELFPREIDTLGQWLAHLSGRLTASEASRALVEVIACLPVYRTYTREEVSAADRRYIEGAVSEAAQREAVPKTSLSFLKRVLLLGFTANIDGKKKTEWKNFIRRWQQLTGAIMAKGFEDTALYNYNRLVSLNEVGGKPDSPGLFMEDFHQWNLTRMKNWPYTLNTTSTHDTKRSEDVRARISVLSEFPDEWAEHLEIWMKYNEAKKQLVNDHLMPEPNTELFLYQTLIGAWPLFAEEVPAFKERLKAYMIKSVREAKTMTSWLKMNQAYEDSIVTFIDAVLENSADNKFLIDFLEFQEKTAYYGALNSLSQLLLKITSPGVPDFYQGMELWDFSLVDPDNRHPVDFKKRKKLLDNITREESSIEDMLSSWQDGRLKLYVTYKTLNFCRDYPELFQNGDYIPLSVSGARREQVCVFARHYMRQWALVAAPRFFTKLSQTGGLTIGKQAYRDDYILVPEDAPPHWRNIFTGEIIKSTGALPVAEVFRAFPVALLVPSV